MLLRLLRDKESYKNRKEKYGWTGTHLIHKNLQLILYRKVILIPSKKSLQTEEIRMNTNQESWMRLIKIVTSTTLIQFATNWFSIKTDRNRHNKKKIWIYKYWNWTSYWRKRRMNKKSRSWFGNSLWNLFKIHFKIMFKFNKNCKIWNNWMIQWWTR